MFLLKQYFFKKKEEKRIKNINIMEETKVTRMCIEDYLLRAAMNQYGKSYGGMIRGATIHMKNLKRDIDMFKDMGVNTSEAEKSLEGYKRSINSYTDVRCIISTPYALELVKEGWVYREKYKVYNG